MPRHPLLVASLGNPAPYTTTLHSAGHLLLNALAAELGYPAFSRSSTYQNGLVSRGQDALLWQCPSYMNVSGPTVAKAWRAFLKDFPRDIDEMKRARLVIVHDELESPLGKIKLKRGRASAKGHNGLKSCLQALPDTEFWRLSVGIDRPSSREPEEVAKYVLHRVTETERSMIANGVQLAATELGKLAEAG